MEIVKNFDLFLFDLDGLLVNTEILHFKAYKEMCRELGFEVKWDMNRYIQEAHFKSQGLREATYAEFPRLLDIQPDWDKLYMGKRCAYERILKEDPIEMMPGATQFLSELAKAEKRRAVVTNSTKAQVDLIRSRVKDLELIPLWITREDYRLAKPNPDGYLKAVEILGKPGDQIVGFEDSPRGIKALQAANIAAMLICPEGHPALQDPNLGDCSHFLSFESILNFY